jgi:hypothetical protein
MGNFSKVFRKGFNGCNVFFRNHIVCLKNVANNLSYFCYVLCHLNVHFILENKLKLGPTVLE